MLTVTELSVSYGPVRALSKVSLALTHSGHFSRACSLIGPQCSGCRFSNPHRKLILVVNVRLNVRL